jgi:hypothetical protein
MHNPARLGVVAPQIPAPPVVTPSPTHIQVTVDVGPPAPPAAPAAPEVTSPPLPPLFLGEGEEPGPYTDKTSGFTDVTGQPWGPRSPTFVYNPAAPSPSTASSPAAVSGARRMGVTRENAEGWSYRRGISGADLASTGSLGESVYVVRRKT